MKTRTLIIAAALTLIPLLGAIAGTTASTSSTVNLNTASVEELMSLPGIGQAKANAIIAYRESHAFKAVDELVEVKGIGPKMIERMKERLTVSNNAPVTVKNQ